MTNIKMTVKSSVRLYTTTNCGELFLFRNAGTRKYLVKAVDLINATGGTCSIK